MLVFVSLEILASNWFGISCFFCIRVEPPLKWLAFINLLLPTKKMHKLLEQIKFSKVNKRC